MKRLSVVLCILAVLAFWVAPAMAGPGRDSLHIGEPTSSDFTGNPLALVIPYFFGDTSKSQFYFLVVASPSKCNNNKSSDGCDNEAHLWFYNTACTRVDSFPIPLTKNDVTVVPLHDPVVTSVREGAVLIGGVDSPEESDIVGSASSPLIAQGLWVDAVRGIGRKIDPATTGQSSGTWKQYHTEWVIPFNPPDSDSLGIFTTMIVSCPTGVNTSGTAGTLGTLGGDMLEIADFDANFVTTAPATAIQAFVFDLDEKFLKDVLIPCRCVGVQPPGSTSFVSEVRMKDLFAGAATQSTYWEFVSQARQDDDVYMIYHGIQVKVTGLNIDWFGRAWSAHVPFTIRGF
jgi:hypothetical protein